ncbi:MAG: hypothetical protein PHP02_00825 [Eubacteriales bacterium]|nr:hypothetical protein [Eubacteriales bacterium]
MLTLAASHSDEQHERLVAAFRALRAGENAEEVKALLSRLGG